MRFFKNRFAFTINTSHHKRLVKVWERLDSVLDFMGPDEYTTIVPLVEGVEEDLKAVVEDIEELAEGQGEHRDTVEAEKEAKEPTNTEADEPAKYTITEDEYDIIQRSYRRVVALSDMTDKDESCHAVNTLLTPIFEDLSMVVNGAREVEVGQGESSVRETVRVGKENITEIHDSWMQLAHIVEIMDQEKYFDLYELLEPIKRRIGNVMIGDWAGLPARCSGEGGAQ